MLLVGLGDLVGVGMNGLVYCEIYDLNVV